MLGTLSDLVKGTVGVWVTTNRRKRSIQDNEIALIKAMLVRGFEKTQIQAYFTHPQRPVNFGRITNIENGEYGPEVSAASSDDLDRFLSSWAEHRGLAIEHLADAALDITLLPPTAERKLLSLFIRKDDGNWALDHKETDNIECKKNFHPNGKLFRAISALANNRGGYVLFGVTDEGCIATGMDSRRFLENDPNYLSQKVRAAMEPMPRIEVGHCLIDGKFIGAIYVHPEVDGPVIAAKDDENFREGTIYYRYPGESRAVRPAEFRKILNERDRRVRQESLTGISRLMELGSRAAIIDMGEKTSEATKIVRESVDDADVLRNFLRQNTVQFPLAYVLRSVNTAKRWLPIFYYIKLSGLSISQALGEIAARETSHVASRRNLVERLLGRKTAYAKPVGRVARILKDIKSNRPIIPETASEAAHVAQAIAGLESTTVDLSRLSELLITCAEAIRRDKSAKAVFWSSLYKAASRLDELYFGERLQTQSDRPNSQKTAA
ncbi:AlbA family DNA-binding domain-containing protein [Microvirga arsenatis]|uniref:Schlafen AlbA-2 domain-containing protein n=1 Tax=Microvirga arsenatis TaxID=2692265 RepID=A0ABW9Z2J8_9HYPH|nr:ATP-binding protein [Microvirga arsenatis]NBJ12704.1 hypothetical protein [Microvirga arsenatis]NBJ26548.1 hypothetical protein [Microvirga arsenatis]